MTETFLMAVILPSATYRPDPQEAKSSPNDSPGASRHRYLRRGLLPGWSGGRLWRLNLALIVVIAACDAASGPRLILIAVLIAGPCCALLTARWPLTAAASGFALALGGLLGVPGQILATATQYALLAVVTIAGAAATVGAAVPQRRHT